MPADPLTDPPSAPPAESPHPLGYDGLPAGSEIRLQYHDGGGAVTIVAPGGEPSADTRRAAAQRTGVSSAAACGAAMLALLAILSPSLQRLDVGLRAAAVCVFVVFSAGVFLLVWKVTYSGRLEMLTRLGAESTVLHADAERLLVETTGPAGDRSIDLPAGDVVRITVAFGLVVAWDIPCLQIERRGGPDLRLLGGRHPAELRRVAAGLTQALRR